jgi:hypothetical protein
MANHVHWPLHAYLIMKISNNILGPEERLSRGTLSSKYDMMREGSFVVKHAKFDSV